jgi:hypothetical protein
MKKARPTRAQLIMAYATMAKANVNTGVRDKKGRVVFQGPRGGRFVRVKGGRKMYSVSK